MKHMWATTQNLIERFPLAKQIGLFLLVGGFCYVIAMGLLWFFVDQLAMEVNLANLISSVITIFINYFLNAKFIFEPGKLSRHKEIAAFYLFSLMGLALNVGLMYLMTTYLPIHYLISKTLIVILVAAFNFITRKFLIFNG